MKRFCTVLFFALSMSLAAPVAFAQDVAPAVEEVAPDKPEVDKAENKEATQDLGLKTVDPTQEGTYVTWVIKAIESKNWPLLAGVLIMLVLLVANKLGLKNKVNKKFIPWIGVLMAVLTSVGTMLVTGIDWKDALVQGFLVGAAASGLWELLKNQLNKWLKKKEPAVEA